MSAIDTRDPMLGKAIGLALGVTTIAIAGLFGTEALPIGDTSVSVLLLGFGGLGVGIGLLARRIS